MNCAQSRRFYSRFQVLSAISLKASIRTPRQQQQQKSPNTSGDNGSRNRNYFTQRGRVTRNAAEYMGDEGERADRGRCSESSLSMLLSMRPPTFSFTDMLMYPPAALSRSGSIGFGDAQALCLRVPHFRSLPNTARGTPRMISPTR